ncbi:MAG: hypothetical protein WBL85_10830 [Sedimentisphaerales bacterium]
MTNRVDLYQPERRGTALPGGGAFVFVEGRLCPELEVVEIARGGMGEFGSARMRNNADSEIEIGKPVVIKWFYNNCYPAGGAEGIAIFVGEVETIETAIGPEDESIEIVARDFSLAMEGISVLGRWERGVDGQVAFAAGAKTIFNENGLANAADETADCNGSRIRAFAAEGVEAKLWDFAEIIGYLLCEYLPAGQLGIPEASRIRALTAGEVIEDLDVTGRSLLEAISRCCERAGVKFKFVPRLGETGPESGIVFYRTGINRAVELNLQKQGERLNISKTNIWKVNASRNADGDTFEVQTPYLAIGFEVGDIAGAAPDSRDVLSTRNNINPAVIERVRMDFGKQTTQLKIVRNRTY